MASPPAPGERRWSASPWLPLVYEQVIHSPDTYGVVILGDAHRDALLVTHGVIREEMWRFHRSPRIAAQGAAYFRYIETLREREAELLAVLVRDGLVKNTGHDVAWKDFPPPPPFTLSESGSRPTTR